MDRALGVLGHGWLAGLFLKINNEDRYWKSIGEVLSNSFREEFGSVLGFASLWESLLA